MSARLQRALTGGVAGVVLATDLLTVSSTVTTASAADAGCPDVQVVFARGSGQTVGSSPQSNRLFSQLQGRLGDGIDVDYYELGAGAHGGHQYPAVNVDDLTNGNAAGGLLSGGGANDYGDSVDEGVAELHSYMSGRTLECMDIAFVLGGFSQGAQVMGDAYEEMHPNTRDRVVFMSLFGDPKLHLPEGEGIMPPACRGQELSPWRRRIGDCHTDNGSLFARKPYLPSSHEWNTGLWCAADDFVCGTTKNFMNNDGHHYWADGGDIDSAAIEIVERLQRRFPDVPEDEFDDDVDVIGTGTTGLDVVFVIDSTGSMSDYIDGAKAYAASMASQIGALRGRVALVEYRDAGDDFVARTLIGLTEDVPAFEAQLATLVADGGGDSPEALLAALMQGLNSLDWRPGATKAAVVLTDAGFHDPDVATGDTLDDVVTRSLEIDPVNVYPVIPSYLGTEFDELADRTSGQVVLNDDGAEAALADALNRIQSRPVALLALDGYLAQPGQQVRFDASDSYPTTGTITSYEWDVDGDGTFEATTAEPVHTHVYDAAFRGQMAVRVTDSAGGIASMSVPVTIAQTLPDPDADLVRPPTGLTATPGPVKADGTREVTLSWQPVSSGPQATSWAVALDGVYVGRTDRTTVTVTETRAAEKVTLSVAGINVDNEVGDRASVTVDPVRPDDALTAPALTLDPVTLTSTGTVRWSGVPAGARVQLAVRRARYRGGFFSWRSSMAAAGADGVKVRELRQGWTACYRARSRKGGAVSAWSGPVCTARPLDDRALRGRGWKRASRKDSYAGTLSLSRPGSKALTVRRVKKSQVGVLVRRCASCGKVQVRAGTRVLATLDTRLRAGQDVRDVVLVRPGKAFRGTISLRPVGKRRVLVDGLALVRMPR